MTTTVARSYSTSTRSSSAMSSSAMSEGQSTDSGISEDGGASRSRHSEATGHQLRSAIDAATALCSMCDEAQSTFLCTQCGRLSFCVDCCVSLHDNKFLSAHKLISLDPAKEGAHTTLAEIKASLAAAKAPPMQVAPLVQLPVHHADPIAVAPTAVAAGGTVRQRSVPKEEEELDLAMLAADRNIITARLNEISACRTLLSDVGVSLSNERFSCKDITRTAVEAVRKKFDVLRNTISDKEAQFVAVIEKAARNRLEAATKLSLEASVSLAECDAFIEQSHNQLERTALNKRLFADARSSMMQSAEERLRSTDDTIQRLQGELDRLTSISLGVHIDLEGACTAVTSLRTPTETSRRVEDAPRIMPIPASQFLATPGVKVHRQQSEIPTNRNATSSPAAPIRQSFHQQIQSLHATPPRDVLEPKRSDAINSTVVSSTSRPMARQGTGDGVAKGRAAYPAELEKLRQQVASSAVQQGGGSRRPSVSTVQHSTVRGRSPLPQQRSTPMRGMSPTSERTRGGGSPARSEMTPGPGAYYQSRDFAARSFLSTPPRRR